MELGFEYAQRWPQIASGLSVPPDTVALLEERDRQLEDFLAALGRGDDEMVFNQFGAVRVATSGRLTVRKPGTLTEIFASLATAGSSTTSVRMLKNGVSMTTFSFATGVQTFSLAITEPLVVGDYYQCEVTAAGTGAGDLTVQLVR